LTGEAYARTGALLFTRLNDAEPLLLGLPVYAGASLEMGNVWADPDDAALDDLLLGGSVFVGADTILGPAFIGYGRSENDRQTLFFFFGRPF
jgi:NTE family protein